MIIPAVTPPLPVPEAYQPPVVAPIPVPQAQTRRPTPGVEKKRMGRRERRDQDGEANHDVEETHERGHLADLVI